MRVPDDRSDVLKGSLLQGRLAYPRNTDDPSIREGEQRWSNPLQHNHTAIPQTAWKQVRELFCTESGCWWVASGDQRVKEWCGQILELCWRSELSRWPLLTVIKENWKRAGKDNITILRPRGSKGGNEKSDGCKRKILSSWTSWAGKWNVTLSNTQGRRKINSCSKSHQKGICFVLI